MQSAATELMDLNKLWALEAVSFRVGEIVQITKKGYALIDYPGNPMGPLVARSIISAPPKQTNEGDACAPVLLVFENGDPSLPIIVGVIHDRLCPPTAQEGISLSAQRPRDIRVDGRKLVFDAKEEIVLRCGKGSITLKADGKVVVKGTQLVSRSAGPNKIKGASVSIN
jgi:Domain of unknown function (DUF6484)